MLMCFNYFAWWTSMIFMMFRQSFCPFVTRYAPSLRLWCHVWAEAVLNYSSSSFFFVLSTTHVLRWPPNIITSKEGDFYVHVVISLNSGLNLGMCSLIKRMMITPCPHYGDVLLLLLWCDKHRKIGKVFHRNGSFLVADSCGRSSVATTIISTFVCVASCGVGEIVIPQEWVAAILLLNTEY